MFASSKASNTHMYRLSAPTMVSLAYCLHCITPMGMAMAGGESYPSSQWSAHSDMFQWGAGDGSLSPDFSRNVYSKRNKGNRNVKEKIILHDPTTKRR